jgi:hypothetical protein
MEIQINFRQDDSGAFVEAAKDSGPSTMSKLTIESSRFRNQAGMVSSFSELSPSLARYPIACFERFNKSPGEPEVSV